MERKPNFENSDPETGKKVYQKVETQTERLERARRMASNHMNYLIKIRRLVPGQVYPLVTKSNEVTDLESILDLRRADGLEDVLQKSGLWEKVDEINYRLLDKRAPQVLP